MKAVRMQFIEMCDVYQIEAYWIRYDKKNLKVA